MTIKTKTGRKTAPTAAAARLQSLIIDAEKVDALAKAAKTRVRHAKAQLKQARKESKAAKKAAKASWQKVDAAKPRSAAAATPGKRARVARARPTNVRASNKTDKVPRKPKSIGKSPGKAAANKPQSKPTRKPASAPASKPRKTPADVARAVIASLQAKERETGTVRGAKAWETARNLKPQPTIDNSSPAAPKDTLPAATLPTVPTPVH